MESTRLLVKRGAITEARLDTTTLPVLRDGEILVRTGAFALTANNISYALTGDVIGYWNFFPASTEWGIVPVWGHAEVVESKCDGVPVGSRFWGFLPMASHVVMQPDAITPGAFVDGAEHRAPLPGLYNRYVRTEGDSPELAAHADARSLLFPLFGTSYLLADYLDDNGLFGAEQVVIGSASSKTGFGLAHYLANLPNRPKSIVGLTSSGNVAFVESLGVCDLVLAYSDLATLEPAVPTVYVDMSGDGETLTSVHRHFGDSLKASERVGATHWQTQWKRIALPGPEPKFFFAPAQVAKRDVEWGQGELLRRANVANLAFVKKLGDGIVISRCQGPDAVAARYDEMVHGRTPPTQGLILSFGEAA